MFLRANILLLTVIASAVLHAAPTDEAVTRKIAIMEVGSKPAVARDALSILPAPSPVPYPSLLLLADEADMLAATPDLDAEDGLLNARWFHILGLKEQLKTEQTWAAQITAVNATRQSVLPLREEK